MLQRLADRVLLQALRAAGARSHFEATDDGPVHWLDVPGQGDLPTAVLLHGLGSSAVHYGSLLRRLRPRVKRIILPDMPGHGQSYHPDADTPRERTWSALRTALDAALDEPAIVFGNSLGGLGAIRYALDRPDNVRGLMLVSPAGAWMNRPDLDAFLAGFEMKSHAHALDFADRLFHRPHMLRHLVAWGVRRRFMAPTIRRLLEGLTQDELLTPAQLQRLKMPVYLVWGGAERILPSDHRNFFVDHLPVQTQREEPPLFGHAPFIDHPNAVARMLLDFAERVSIRPV